MIKICSLILLLMNYTGSVGQDFVVKPLVTIPGDNKNINVISTSVWRTYPGNTYICWENKLDSIFTIYVKELDSLSTPIKTVYSSTNHNCNPSISICYNEYENNNFIRVAWQSLRNNHWRIYSRDYCDDSFSDVKELTDTMTNNTNPTLDSRSIVWIQEGKLMCYLYFSKLEIVDSFNCSNPRLLQSSGDLVILYEKGSPPNTQIFLAQYKGWPGGQTHYWQKTQISDSGYNINPSFGTNHNISYQTLVNSKWNINYSYGAFWDTDLLTMKSDTYNKEHPIVFSYYVPALVFSKETSRTNFPGGYFTAFDSDSLLDNKEVFIFYSFGYTDLFDSLFNISNSSGNDIKPLISVLKTNESKMYKICILWEHNENNKTDIWWATSKFYFSTSDIGEDNINQISFSLSQNYPNPFNPSTVISYHLSVNSNVSLKIYNTLGQEVETLVDGFQNAGFHSSLFTPSSSLSSGIYFYVLKAEETMLCKKMCLIK
jgi:hypothetical protein